MFENKLASRADETTTSELSFSGHKLGRQKKVSKTQCFFNVFWPPEIHVIIWAPRLPKKTKNINFSQIKRYVSD